MDVAFIQHAQQLDASLASVAGLIVDYTQDRIHAIEALDLVKCDHTEKEPAFWIAADANGWLRGSNETERKLAKQRAYQEHGNDEPWRLHDHAREIARLELEIETLTQRLGMYKSELEALRARVPLLAILVQSEQVAAEFKQFVVGTLPATVG